MMIAILAMMSVLSADEIPVELPQNPDRPSISSAELKGLRENNVFSPYRTKPFEPKRGSDPRPPAPGPAPSKPKPLVVTGLFSDPVTGVPKGIVEDRNEERHRHLKEPKFVVGGEEFAGLKVEAVTADHIVVVRGDVRKECKVGDALPEGDPPPAASTTSEPTSDSKPGETAPSAAPALDDASKNSIIEALKARNKKRRDEP